VEVVLAVWVKQGIHDSFVCWLTARLCKQVGHKPSKIYEGPSKIFLHNHMRTRITARLRESLGPIAPTLRNLECSLPLCLQKFFFNKNINSLERLFSTFTTRLRKS
jgi:hypothetical protein